MTDKLLADLKAVKFIGITVFGGELAFFFYMLVEMRRTFDVGDYIILFAVIPGLTFSFGVYFFTKTLRTFAKAKSEASSALAFVLLLIGAAVGVGSLWLSVAAGAHVGPLFATYGLVIQLVAVFFASIFAKSTGTTNIVQN